MVMVFSYDGRGCPVLLESVPAMWACIRSVARSWCWVVLLQCFPLAWVHAIAFLAIVFSAIVFGNCILCSSVDDCVFGDCIFDDCV